MSGGVSGFFGPLALALELPSTTTLMLRSIADIARHHGEDLSRIEARLACLEVLGLGARRSRGDVEVGYYATRAMLARLTADASAVFIERGAATASAPAVGSLVAEIAGRFGVVVSERAAASALPVLGALGGAGVNALFMQHFQRVAHGHFTVRRLERLCGVEAVRSYFQSLEAERPADEPRRFAAPMMSQSPVDHAPTRAPSPMAAKSPEEKLADLRRMRTIATSLLAAMAVVFFAASATHAPWPWLPYLRAFAEAGMVGACADWFAVVALFRRPFGLPIPHTAVVPANKQRIGAALGRFITNNFLSTRVASERLASVDALLMFARWIGDRENSRKTRRLGGPASARGRRRNPPRAPGRIRRRSRTARPRRHPSRAARLAGALDPVGAGRGPGPARAGARILRGRARAQSRLHCAQSIGAIVALGAEVDR